MDWVVENYGKSPVVVTNAYKTIRAVRQVRGIVGQPDV